MWRKLTVILPLLGTLAACSPAQFKAWKAWYREDPQAAADWARNECGDLCTADWDRDGVVEPEPTVNTDVESVESTSDGGWSDVTVTPDEAEDAGVGIYWPWDALAECESGGNWQTSTGNGYYGGLQFSLGSWQAAGGSGYPHENSASEQIHRGEILQDMQGWNAWPTCARIIGLI